MPKRKDAIQKDVSESTENDHVDDDNQDNEAHQSTQNVQAINRLSAMDEIAERVAVEREKEMSGQSDADEEGDDDDEAQDDTAAKPTDESQGDEQGDESGDENASDDDYVVGKVDGKEVKYSKQELLEEGLRAKQKESAADARLEQATRLLKEAEQRAAQLGQFQSPPSGQDAGQQQDKQLPGGPDAEVNFEDLAEAISYGSEDEKAQALKTLAEYGRAQGAPQVNPDQIVALVEEKTAFNQAVEMINSDPEQGGFNDIMSDPYLKNMFYMKEREANEKARLEGGDDRSYKQLYMDIGNEIREWRDSMMGKKPTPTNTEGFDDIEKRKKDMPTPIKGGGQRAVNEGGRDKPKTEEQKRREAIEGIRKARGQVG
jgi:hypothetical protein